MIVAVTGHRPPKLGGYRTPNPVYAAVIQALRTELLRLAPELVLSGMALGVDQWTAQICVDNQIPFDAIIPFHGFESRWPQESQRNFERLCSHARQVIVVTDTHEYRASYLYRRNAWMVDHSSQVLAVWNGSPGGTANCVEYARRRNKPVGILQLGDWVWTAAQEQERSTQEWRARRAADIQQLLGPQEASPATPGVPMQETRVFRRRTPPTGTAEAATQALTMIMDPDQVPRVGVPGDRVVATIAGVPVEQLPTYIQERLASFVGQPATPETLALIRQTVQQVLDGLRAPSHLGLRPTGGQPAAVAAGYYDQWADEARTAQPRDVTPQEPPKSQISPENRFVPGRVIDLDD